MNFLIKRLSWAKISIFMVLTNTGPSNQAENSAPLTNATHVCEESASETIFLFYLSSKSGLYNSSRTTNCSSNAPAVIGDVLNATNPNATASQAYGINETDSNQTMYRPNYGNASLLPETTFPQNNTDNTVIQTAINNTFQIQPGLATFVTTTELAELFGSEHETAVLVNFTGRNVSTSLNFNAFSFELPKSNLSAGSISSLNTFKFAKPSFTESSASWPDSALQTAIKISNIAITGDSFALQNLAISTDLISTTAIESTHGPHHDAADEATTPSERSASGSKPQTTSSPAKSASATPGPQAAAEQTQETTARPGRANTSSTATGASAPSAGSFAGQAVLAGLESWGPVQVLLPTVSLGAPSPTSESNYALPSPYNRVQIQVPAGAWP